MCCNPPDDVIIHLLWGRSSPVAFNNHFTLKSSTWVDLILGSRYPSSFCSFHLQTLVWTLEWCLAYLLIFHSMPSHLVGSGLPSYPPGHILFLAGFKMKSQDVTPTEICALFSHSEVLFWSRNDLDRHLPYSLLVPFPGGLHKQLISKHYTHSACNLPILSFSNNLIQSGPKGQFFPPVLPTSSTELLGPVSALRVRPTFYPP